MHNSFMITTKKLRKSVPYRIRQILAKSSFDTFCSLCSFASFSKSLLSEIKVHVFPFPSGTLFQNVPIQVCILFIDNSPSSSVTGVFIRRLRWCEKNDAHYCEAIAPSV